MSTFLLCHLLVVWLWQANSLSIKCIKFLEQCLAHNQYLQVLPILFALKWSTDRFFKKRNTYILFKTQTTTWPLDLWVMKGCGSEVWSPALSTTGFRLIWPKPPLFYWRKGLGSYNSIHHVWHPPLAIPSWEGRQQHVLLSLLSLSSFFSFLWPLIDDGLTMSSHLCLFSLADTHIAGQPLRE